MYKLEDFNREILRPMALNGIAKGQFDGVIFGSDLDEVYANDREMMNAIKYRRAVLEQKEIK